jgi:thiol:disulfide interchange protein
MRIKKSLLFIVFSFCISAVYSQAIQFQSLSWHDALAKAKRENKLMFIDMFASWCTYCRQMDATVFTDTATGTFYNSHFICLKYDVLKQDGILVKRNYTLLGFPTFLYLDENGMLIGKTVGYQNKGTFINNGKTAFDLGRKNENQNTYRSLQMKL